MPSNKKRALSLFLLIVLVQTAVFFGLKSAERRFGDLDGDTRYSYPIHGQDSPSFALLGENLLKLHRFTLNGINPETFRTPGYPALIALSKSLTGGLDALIFLQIVLSGINGVILLELGKRFSGERLALAAALIFSLSPSLIFHSVIVLSEIPFVFLLLAAVYLSFFSKRRLAETFLGGVALGLSALVRPVSLYLPVLFAAFLIYRFWPKGWKEGGRYTLALLAGFLLIVFPWFSRNEAVAHAWAFSSVGAYNIAHYNIPQFLSDKYGPDSAEFREYNAKLDAIPAERAYSLQGEAELKAVYEPILKKNLLSYAYYHLVTTLKFFFSSNLRYIAIHLDMPRLHSLLGLSGNPPDLLSAVRHGHVALAIEALKTQWLLTIDRLLTALLALLALSAIFIKQRRFYTLLFAALILYFALLTGPVAIPRYRLPVEPFILILALFASKHYYSKWRSKEGAI